MATVAEPMGDPAVRPEPQLFHRSCRMERHTSSRQKTQAFRSAGVPPAPPEIAFDFPPSALPVPTGTLIGRGGKRLERSFSRNISRAPSSDGTLSAYSSYIAR